MKKLLLISALGLFGSLSMFATSCSSFIGTAFNTIGSCTDSVTLGSGGTVVITFSGFGDGGSGALVSAIEQNSANGQVGFQLAGASGQPLSAFSGLGYTASVTSCTPGIYACSIFAQYQQASFGVPGNLSGTVSFSGDTCGAVPTLTPANSTFAATLCTSPIPTGSNDVVVSAYSTGTNILSGMETDVFVNAANTAVPEPTAFVLMGAGLGLLGMLRRKTARR